MKYYSKKEIENAIKNNEKIIINNKVIDDMKSGIIDSYILREGLCGRNLRNFDFSNLSDDHLVYLSFDTETEFPKHLQPKANELLESSKEISKDITKLHNLGLNGTGKRITIIDTPFEMPEEYDNIDYYKMDGIPPENHGITVLSIIKSIAPNTEITFIGDNKRAGKERIQNLDDFLKNKVNTNKLYNSDIVSISSSVTVDKQLFNQNCEILNSPRFYSSPQNNIGFRYGFVNRKNNIEKIEPADCISEGNNRKIAEDFCIKNLMALGLNYTKITPNNIYEILDRLKNMGIPETHPKLSFIKNVALMSDDEFRLNSINYDKTITPGINCNSNSVCIPSSGITVRQNGNKFKYISTNSNSFSIPIVSALFILARQIEPEITLKDFSCICQVTSTNENGYRIISPTKAFELIQEQSNIKSTHDNAGEEFEL